MDKSTETQKKGKGRREKRCRGETWARAGVGTQERVMRKSKEKENKIN